ncbi:hypothetical protein L218DRAFT_1023936, partial [Marasmius fiardii PR-910]
QHSPSPISLRSDCSSQSFKPHTFLYITLPKPNRMMKCGLRVLLLIIRATLSGAFGVNPLPSTATPGQTETLTWLREKSDPTRFVFAEQFFGTPIIINPTISVGNTQLQGTLLVTFMNAGSQMTIVAYERRDGDDAVPPIIPFFIDNQEIFIATATTSPTAVASPVSISPFSTSPSPMTSTMALTTSKTTNTDTLATGQADIVTSTQAAQSSDASRTITSPSVPTSTFNSPSVHTFTSSSQTTRQSNAGVIAGAIVGGVIGLLVVIITMFIIFKKRRHRNLVKMQEREEIIVEKAQLQAQLEVYENESQVLGSGNGAAELDQEVDQADTVQFLRRHIDALNQKVAALEAELAPPDYNSGTGSV